MSCRGTVLSRLMMSHTICHQILTIIGGREFQFTAKPMKAQGSQVILQISTPDFKSRIWPIGPVTRVGQ